MNISLRDYQLELVDAVWNEICSQHTALAVLPTGGGKTVCVAELMKRAMQAKPTIRIAMVMGRIDLVNQTERALSRVIDRRHIGVYCGSMGRKEYRRPITVASIQSIRDIAMRGMLGVSPIDLLIVDETHNLDQKAGSYYTFIEKCRDENSKLKIVGFTATPFRSTGEIFGAGKLFSRVCYRKTIKEMIALGFLCQPVLKQGNDAFDTSKLRVRAGEYVQEDVDALVSDDKTVELQVKDALARMQGRQCIAWATANIDHCNRVLDALEKENERGTSVHSKQSKETRSANLAAFMGGTFRHMVFVSVLTEGFDHPPIDTVILMRPTRSPVLYVQVVGRGLRIYPEKLDCLVLDYGQVVSTLGPLDDPKVKGKKAQGEAVLKLCPTCALWVPGGSLTCPECGHQFPERKAPEQSLSRTHDQAAEILSSAPKPETLTLGPARIAMHKAKSGNDCVRITYQDGNMMNRWGGHDGVSEYFVVTSPWAMERLERRLTMIGADLPGIPFEGEILCDGTFELVKTSEGKYDRVMAVRRTSDESPRREIKKTYLDDLDDDVSFAFGKNVRGSQVEF
jgi:DNA repair protein RadD